MGLWEGVVGRDLRMDERAGKRGGREEPLF